VIQGGLGGAAFYVIESGEAAVTIGGDDSGSAERTVRAGEALNVSPSR
jgi:mannose-6-phosphate isomerase-like protein (cupin superfamily)